MKKLLALLMLPPRAMLHGMAVGLCVGLVLALWFSAARLLMLAYYWPSPGSELWAELPVALLMGFRFDLKMGAIAALLLFPWLGWRWRMSAVVVKVWASLFALLAVINFYYYGFYKLPIDSVIFGLADDDTVAVVLLMLAGLWWLLHKTAFGRVVRAGTQRPDMVAVLGIELNRYMTSVVVLGVGLAALAGVLMAPLAGVHPAMGAEIMTAAFVVVVIGGLGSFWGVVLAAALVGVCRGVTTYFYPPASEASMYVLMMLVLLLRPRGLLGERIERFE